jgi:hypothetical protein
VTVSSYRALHRTTRSAPARRCARHQRHGGLDLPIEDSIITATQGNRKDLVTRGNRGHMGNPGAEDILYNWLDKAVAEQP